MDKVDTQEFYELMQDYRNAPIEDQYLVSEKFNKVKSWIKRNYRRLNDKDEPNPFDSIFGGLKLWTSTLKKLNGT